MTINRSVSVAVSLIIAGLTTSVACAAPTIAQARTTSAPGSTLKVRFSHLRGRRLLGDGRYVYVYGGSYAVGTGVLVDGSDGHRTAIREPGCGSPAALGSNSLVFECPTRGGGVTFELYDIATGTSEALLIDRTLDATDCPDLTHCTFIDDVGSDWVVTQQVCLEHCGVLAFQNLATGAVQTTYTSTASTALDLSSPTLTRKLCPGVTAPIEAPVSGEAAPLTRGLVRSDGRFQIVSGYDVSVLEECGTHLKQFLTYSCELYPCAPAANSRSIVWESRPGRLTGVRLPSLKRFQIKIPATLDPSAAGATYVRNDEYGLALTPNTLYLSTSGGIWTAPAPTAG